MICEKAFPWGLEFRGFNPRPQLRFARQSNEQRVEWTAITNFRVSYISTQFNLKELKNKKQTDFTELLGKLKSLI